MTSPVADVVVCGAGIAGVATAYFLSVVHGVSNLVVVDPHAPLSQTSARSGENYRNWWPDPILAQLTTRSITLMESLARASGNMFQMHRRGYLYTTSDPAARATLPRRLARYGDPGIGTLRIHGDGSSAEPYRAAAPALDDRFDGADLLLGSALIRATFPHLVHVRPEGGRDSEWIKLGWAFNRHPEEPDSERSGTPEFPEVVLRGACRMVPGLRAYLGRLPTPVVHYGGYYTKTPDGLPLVGPLGVDGAHVVGALAGYGTMAACAVGELAAAWVVGSAEADYARALVPSRLGNAGYLASLSSEEDRGEL